VEAAAATPAIGKGLIVDDISGLDRVLTHPCGVFSLTLVGKGLLVAHHFGIL
jgi:hypothetical protein